MAVLEGGVSAALAGIGVEASSPLHVIPKPIPYGALGHYRVNHRCALVASQAANSRLFEVRNTHATNLIVPTRLVVRIQQTGAFTANLSDSLDLFKCTTFTAVDTTNTVTPTVSVKRSSLAAPPGAAAIRGLTVAGNSAGMTGGNLTKDGGSFCQIPFLAYTTANTTTLTPFQLVDCFDDVNGTSPFVFVQNEGFEIELRVVFGAAASMEVYFDFSWAEVTAF